MLYAYETNFNSSVNHNSFWKAWSVYSVYLDGLIIVYQFGNRYPETEREEMVFRKSFVTSLLFFSLLLMIGLFVCFTVCWRRAIYSTNFKMLSMAY